MGIFLYLCSRKGLDNVKVVIFDRMDQCTEAEVQRLLPLVSAQRREQALRYKHTFGQFCCLKSWVMLKGLVDERISGLEDEGISGLMDAWEYNEYGKPFFTPSPLHSFTPYFSISHCKEAIAVAIDDKPIGIDIESIRHADEDLLERVLSKDERMRVERMSELVERDRAFTRLWTRKEAVVKAIGTGIESFEQLQTILNCQQSAFCIQTFESDKYIYSIAVGD